MYMYLLCYHKIYILICWTVSHDNHLTCLPGTAHISASGRGVKDVISTGGGDDNGWRGEGEWPNEDRVGTGTRGYGKASCIMS